MNWSEEHVPIPGLKIICWALIPFFPSVPVVEMLEIWPQPNTIPRFLSLFLSQIPLLLLGTQKKTSNSHYLGGWGVYKHFFSPSRYNAFVCVHKIPFLHSLIFSEDVHVSRTSFSAHSFKLQSYSFSLQFYAYFSYLQLIKIHRFHNLISG